MTFPGSPLPPPAPQEGATEARGPLSAFVASLHPVLFVLVTLAGIFFLYQVVGGVATLLLFGGGVTADNVGVVRAATLVGQVLFLLLPTLLLTRLRHGVFAAPLRLRWPGWTPVVAAAVGVLALQQVLQGYLVLQEAVPLPLPEKLLELLRQLRSMMEELTSVLVTSHSVPEFLAVVLVVAVAPAVCEEILFRGLIQRNLEAAYAGVRGGVLAGVVFGLFHLNLFALVPLCVLGAYFGYLVYRSGSIVPAVLAHFLNNLVAAVAMYFQWDEDALVLNPAGEATLATGALSVLLFGLVFLGATSYFVRATRPPVHAA